MGPRQSCVKDLGAPQDFHMFTIFRALSLLLICLQVSTLDARAQVVGQYREFALGTSVQAVTTLAQIGAAPVQTTAAAQEKARLENKAAFRP